MYTAVCERGAEGTPGISPLQSERFSWKGDGAVLALNPQLKRRCACCSSPGRCGDALDFRTMDHYRKRYEKLRLWYRLCFVENEGTT